MERIWEEENREARTKEHVEDLMRTTLEIAVDILAALVSSGIV